MEAWLPNILTNGLIVTRDELPTNKYNIKSPFAMTPTRVVIHNTANDASSDNEIKYMNTNNNEVSFHFAVDNVKVVQGIGLNRNAWHAGDGNGKGNREGIGIEICYSKSGGNRFIDAEVNASKLAAYLLNQMGWGIDRITKHQDYSGKYCPHRTLDMGWDRFLSMVSNELDVLKTISGPYAPGIKVYNLVDLVLNSTAHQTGTTLTIPKNSLNIVNKYYLLNGVLWISLFDENGNLRTGSWTSELDKLSLLPVDDSLEEVLMLKNKIKELENTIKEKDKIINEAEEELSKYENAELFKKK